MIFYQGFINFVINTKDLKNEIVISVVSYINTLPLHYGLKKAKFDLPVRFEIDYPAECARKLISGQVDIGLVPVITLNQLPDSYTVSNYCLSAIDKVRSVILAGNCPVTQMQRIFLDDQSRTSAALVKILARQLWKINPEFQPCTVSSVIGMNKNEGILAIGDKSFAVANQYKYCYDLAFEWRQMTGLPFVFACWVAKHPLPDSFIKQFNEALAYGVSHIEEAVNDYAQYNILSKEDLLSYLQHNLSFIFDEKKKKGLELFLKMVK